uniref:Uncharacterized protein n=1 Tax=Zosterops lateralis melanops TaxID=1220523 RepID=A0A8D2PUD2_ZOSLA
MFLKPPFLFFLAEEACISCRHQPCTSGRNIQMLPRTSSVVAQVFLLLSIVLVIAIAVIQINQQQILSPGSHADNDRLMPRCTSWDYKHLWLCLNHLVACESDNGVKL